MDNSFVRNSHCGFCGTQFANQENWPRRCLHCTNESYRNPLPVVVTVLSVRLHGRVGSLIQKRNINPHKGSWALTGGYIDYNESWQNAAVREVKEELGIVTDPNCYKSLSVESNDHNNLIVFCYYDRVIPFQDIEFVPNSEVSDIKVVFEPVELCFPTHTETLKKFISINR